MITTETIDENKLACVSQKPLKVSYQHLADVEWCITVVNPITFVRLSSV